MAQTTIQVAHLTALTSGLSTTDEIIVSAAGVVKRMDISVLALDGAQITSGTVPVARLGDGNESNSTFLRGDNTWQAAGGIASVAADTTPQVGGSAGFDLQAQLLVGNGGTTGIAVSSAGEVTMAAQPAFVAVVGSAKNNVTGTNAYIIAYDNDSATGCFDIGSNYNTSTFTFTAPVTGKYQFDAHVRLKDLSTYNPNIITTEFVISNLNFSFYHGDIAADASGGTSIGLTWSTLAEMDANDTCQCRLSCSGGASGGTDDGIDVDGDTGTAQSSFSGFLVG